MSKDYMTRKCRWDDISILVLISSRTAEGSSSGRVKQATRGPPQETVTVTTKHFTMHHVPSLAPNDMSVTDHTAMPGETRGRLLRALSTLVPGYVRTTFTH